MLVWCKLSLACVLLVLAILHHSPPMVGSQTLAQEERFEACCEKSKIPLTSKCSYRMLLWMFNYGPEVDTNPPPNLKDDLTGDMLFFGCDHWDYACANKLWPSYIECLNNGMDNRECCFATTNFIRPAIPLATNRRECTPFCNGVAPVTMDMDYLNKTKCVYHWREVTKCAMKA